MGAVNSFKFYGFDLSLPFVAKAHIKMKAPKLSLPCSQLYRDTLGPKCGDSTLQRLRSSYRGSKGMEQCFRVSTISCSMEDINGEHNEKEQSFSTDYKQYVGDGKDYCPQGKEFNLILQSRKEAAIDLKLPRRSLLVTFTCDACGARLQRLINRLAYERGLVYVQCSGCSQYHKLVDNLGLVIEYNLQEESNLDANIDQV